MADDEWTWGGILLVFIIIMVIMIILYFLWIWWMISSVGGTMIMQQPVVDANGDTAYVEVEVPVDPYRFVPYMDSGGNDIKNARGLANNIPELQGTCTALPNCRGFNTNGWLKHTLRPESQWNKWTSDPNKGFYVKN